MNWEIQYNGTIKTFAELGLGHLKRKLWNRSKDKVTFSSARAVHLDSLFEAEAYLEIWHERRWFGGIVTRVPSVASGSGEGQVYEVSSPWWFLENLVYQQGWAGVKEREQSSRVVLGQGEDGKPLKVDGQIREILKYAVDRGALFQVGRIDGDVQVPLDEVKDMSCSECIQRLLRWVPDAVLYFDYAVDGLPVLNIVRQGALTKWEVDFRQLTSFQVTPRKDLQNSGVELKYERTNEVEGNTFRTLEVERFPNTKVNDFKKLVLTLELEGSTSQVITQALTVQSVEPDTIDWWKQHLPALATMDVAKMAIKNVRRKGNLANEIVAGSVAKWMGKQVEDDILSATLVCEDAQGSQLEQSVAVKIHTTDAISHVYKKTLAGSPGDPMPKGLAEVLYTALSKLTYEGTIRWIQDNPVVSLANTLSLLNGRNEWSTMNAAIQAISQSIDTGEVEVTFGPPKHLGGDDLIELLQLNRHRRSTLHAHLRSSQSPQQAWEQSTHGRLENGHSSAPLYQRLTFTHPEKRDRRVTLDANALTKDVAVSIQEDFVCHNGKLKKRYALTSAPFEF